MGQWQVTRPWPFVCKEKTWKQSKVFIRKKSTVHVDRHIRKDSESYCQLIAVSHVYGAFLPRFPLANHLALPGSDSILVYLQDPP